jgi:hypothetical protein
MKHFNEGDDVIVTEVSNFGRKTVIWRGRFVRYEEDFFNVMTDEGEMSFSLGCGLKAANG